MISYIKIYQKITYTQCLCKEVKMSIYNVFSEMFILYGVPSTIICSILLVRLFNRYKKSNRIDKFLNFCFPFVTFGILLYLVINSGGTLPGMLQDLPNEICIFAIDITIILSFICLMGLFIIEEFFSIFQSIVRT